MWKITFAYFTLLLHSNNYVTSYDNGVGKWPGHDCNKEHKDFFKQGQRERKGVPVPGIALSQGQTDENRPDQVAATAAIFLPEKKTTTAGTGKIVGKDKGPSVMSVTGETG